jgi:hypothetical protein
MNPSISLIMGIITLFDWRMKYFLCFIGPKDSHPELNWMAIHFQILIGPLKVEEAVYWCKGFRGFIGQGEQAQGVMEAHSGRGHCVYVEKQEGGGEGV